MPAYEYRPLSHPQEFRLLKLHRGASGTDSRTPELGELELVHARIGASPDFETVSYAWCSTQQTHVVHLLDGKMIPVTQTVEQLLPYLIRACTTGHLWLDQICIRQDDLEERTAQVAIMADIYKTAKSTLVWLGEPDSHTETILKIIHLLGSQDRDFAFRGFKYQTIHSNHYPQDKYTMNSHLLSLCNGTATPNCSLIDVTYDFDPERPSVTKVVSYCKTCTLRSMREFVTAGGCFMNHPWFSRCWVVQEVVLSKQVRFLVGTIHIAPYDLQRAISIARRNYLGLTKVMTDERDIQDEALGFRPFLFMLNFWEGYETGKFPFFASLLEELRCFSIRGRLQATDKRDIIYSLIGLHHQGRSLIRPNYELSVKEVYIDATRAIIEETGDLSFVGLCDGLYRVDQVETLPSWVPDWSQEMGFRPIVYPSIRGGAQFSASRGLKPPTEVRSQMPHLRVKGKRVDTIGAVHPQAFEQVDPDRLNENPELLGLRCIVQDLTASSPSFSFQLTEERIFRVMVLGIEEDMSKFHNGSLKTALYFSSRRRIAMSGRGKVVLAPSPSAPGDDVWIIHGCPTPLILRKKKDNDYWLVGVCFIEDCMDGEAVSWTDEEADVVFLV